jgi:hypothetical protein
MYACNGKLQRTNPSLFLILPCKQHIKGMCLCCIHKGTVAQMVMSTYAPIARMSGEALESLSPQFNFSNAHTTEPVRPVGGLMSKTEVGPWFSKFFPVRWRGQSCALNKPVRSLVPVFSGSTGESVCF